MPPRALVWGLMTALVLLAWPWMLAWIKMRRPALLAGDDVPDLAALRAVLLRPVPPLHAAANRPREPERQGGGALLVWAALATAASLIPMGNGWLAADLDAGLLWLAALALAATASLRCGDRWSAVPAAGALLTLFLCLSPLAMHTASLHLADLAMMQQGGAGNWFLVRDPFLLLSGAVYLLTAATLWPSHATGGTGLEGLLSVSARIGLPLVLAHLFTVAYLGAWWAFLPALDGLGWLHTILKNIIVLALLLWLRRRPAWCSTRHLVWRLPLAALTACLGAVAWLVFSGAVH